MGIISDCTKSKKESSLRRLFFLPLKYYKTQKWESYDLVKEECLEKITKKKGSYHFIFDTTPEVG